MSAAAPDWLAAALTCLARGLPCTLVTVAAVAGPKSKIRRARGTSVVASKCPEVNPVVPAPIWEDSSTATSRPASFK